MVGNFGPGCCCDVTGCQNGYPSTLTLASPDWQATNGPAWIATYGSGMELVNVGHARFENNLIREYQNTGVKWTAWLQMPGAGPWNTVTLAASLSIASNWAYDTAAPYTGQQVRFLLGDILIAPFFSGGIQQPGEMSGGAAAYFLAIHRQSAANASTRTINCGAYINGVQPQYSKAFVLNQTYTGVVTRGGGINPQTLDGVSSGSVPDGGGFNPPNGWTNQMCALKATIAFMFAKVPPLTAIEAKVESLQITVT